MYTSEIESNKDLKKANAPHKIEIRERKYKMAKKIKGGHKQGEREVRSKKAGFYVQGHKNYGDVYEA